MSYVLDGIKTGFDKDNRGAFPKVTYRCPCGWTAWYIVGASRQDPTLGGEREVHAALRFHYTHCPRARRAGEHASKESEPR